MNCCRFNSNEGVTLIELIVVLSIIFILMGAAVMNFASYTTKRDTENDIKQLYSDLMKARALAVTQSRTVQLVFSNTNPKSYRLVTDLNDDGDFDDEQETLDSGNLKLDVLWNNNPSSGINISFSSKGIASSNGTFSINVPDVEYNCITVFATRINLGRLSGGQCEAK